MTMILQYRADSFSKPDWKEVDMDNPADVEAFDAIDWTMVAVHLREGEEIVIRCKERDDDHDGVSE